MSCIRAWIIFARISLAFLAKQIEIKQRVIKETREIKKKQSSFELFYYVFIIPDCLALYLVKNRNPRTLQIALFDKDSWMVVAIFKSTLEEELYIKIK